MTGTVIRVKAERGFAFIKPDDGGPDVFLFCRDLSGAEFDEALNERRVEFSVEVGDKGPRAKNVRLITS